MAVLQRDDIELDLTSVLDFTWMAPAQSERETLDIFPALYADYRGRLLYIFFFARTSELFGNFSNLQDDAPFVRVLDKTRRDISFFLMFLKKSSHKNRRRK